MDQFLKCQWIPRICSKISKIIYISIYIIYIYIYVCVCVRHLVSGYISELSIFISSYIIGSQATLVHDIATCHGHLAWRFGYEVGVSLLTLVVRHSHVTISFIRVSRMVNHQHAPATNHWFRKCIYSWMWGCFDPFPSNVLAPKNCQEEVGFNVVLESFDVDRTWTSCPMVSHSSSRNTSNI